MVLRGGGWGGGGGGNIIISIPMFLVLVVWEQVVLGRYLRCFFGFSKEADEIMWGQGCMWMIKRCRGGGSLSY